MFVHWRQVHYIPARRAWTAGLPRATRWTSWKNSQKKAWYTNNEKPHTVTAIVELVMHPITGKDNSVSLPPSQTNSNLKGYSQVQVHGILCIGLLVS